MKKFSAEETLNYLIDLFLYYLEEELSGTPCPEDEQFILGERTAYVECLEIIQYWEHARKNGLDFNIEAKFPI